MYCSYIPWILNGTLSLIYTYKLYIENKLLHSAYCKFRNYCDVFIIDVKNVIGF